MSSTGSTPPRLDAADIEAIAVRVAELLRDVHHNAPARLVDAATVADMLGVERDWVYENADRLGAIRLGGPRGRLRFDITAVLRDLGRKGGLPSAVALASRQPQRGRRSHSPKERR